MRQRCALTFRIPARQEIVIRLRNIPMNDKQTELPVFLALKEKAVRFRDKLADKLNERAYADRRLKAHPHY